MRRRRVLASTDLLVAGTAGCSGGDPRAGTETATPVEITTDRATPTRTATDDVHAADRPDPDLAVVFENRADDVNSLSLTVARDEGDVVHESVHDVDPGAEFEAYNLRSADPDGVERFGIAVASGDQREAVAVQTSECYGDVRFAVETGRELTVTYAVC